MLARNRTPASFLAWAPDLDRRVRSRPGNRERQLVARSSWLVARGLWPVVVSRDSMIAVCNRHKYRGLKFRIRQSSLPWGRVGGGVLETGKWPVACGLWKYRDSPALACLGARFKLPTPYHVLRTTYCVQLPHPTSHIPHPTSYNLAKDFAAQAAQPLAGVFYASVTGE